jgi:putative NIF3 family GTP cyclohydrolase 1 type 2
MNDLHIGRRACALGLASSAALAQAGGLGRSTGVTARGVIDRIKTVCAQQGVVWAAGTVDTVKIGDPDTVVTGIAGTFMATLDVMQRAAAGGINLIVSHEPIFYNHLDRTDAFETDPVYRAKRDYAARHGLVVWRFHDHWHRLQPEPMSTATIAALGWEGYADPLSTGFMRRFSRPPIGLKALVAEMAQRLPTNSIRFVGDPAMPVITIAQIAHSITGLIEAFDGCDVAIPPEIREWDCVEYVRDAIALGERKGLILIAHERAEQAGMARCVQWLRTVVADVPVRFIPSGEPFSTLPARI